MPMVGGESCLLTDEDRALLAQFGGVETALDQDQRMDREMMLIYECCTMPSAAALPELFRPRCGRGGKAPQPCDPPSAGAVP